MRELSGHEATQWQLDRAWWSCSFLSRWTLNSTLNIQISLQSRKLICKPQQLGHRLRRAYTVSNSYSSQPLLLSTHHLQPCPWCSCHYHSTSTLNRLRATGAAKKKKKRMSGPLSHCSLVFLLSVWVIFSISRLFSLCFFAVWFDGPSVDRETNTVKDKYFKAEVDDICCQFPSTKFSIFAVFVFDWM